MADNKLNPLNNLPEKPVKMADIAFDVFKSRDQLTPVSSPGISSDLNFETFSEELGQEFKLQKGNEQLVNMLNADRAEAAYNEAKQKADEQGLFGEAVAALSQAGAEIVGGTIEGIGYLLDFEHWGSRIAGGEGDWGNWLSSIGTALKDETREALPVYVDPDNEGKFRPWSHEWWFSNLPSVASSLSLLIPAVGTVRAVGMLGKALNVGTKLGKAAPWVTPVGEAIVSRHMENMMEANQVFNESFEKYKQTMSEEEAKAAASDAAAFSYRHNWAMIAQDIPQYMLLGRGIKASKAVDSVKLAKAAGINPLKAIANKQYNLAKDMVGEGLEEGYQFIVAEEAKRYGDIKAGLDVSDDSFSERLGGYLSDEELWTSAFFGGFGAATFQTLGKPISNYINRKSDPQFETETEQRIKEVKDRGQKVAFNADAYKAAVATGNPHAVHKAKEQIALDLGITAAKAGNVDLLIDNLNKFKSATAEEREQLGIDEEFAANIDTFKEDIKKIAEIYEKTANNKNYAPNTIEPIVLRTYQIAKANEQLPKIREKIQELKASYPRINDLSPLGKQVFDMTLQAKGAENFQTFSKWRMEKTNMSPKSKEQLESFLTISKEAQQKAIKAVKELMASDAISKEDKDILTGLEGALGDEIAKQVSWEKTLTHQIDTNTSELTELTSKEFQGKNKEAFEKAKKQAEANANKAKQAATKEADDAAKEASTRDIKDILKTAEETPKEDPIVSEMDKVNREVNGDKTVESSPLKNSKIANAQKKVDEINKKSLDEIETADNTAVDTEQEKLAEKDPDTVGLTKPLAAAWKSVRNDRVDAETKNNPDKIALSDFLENPNINIKDYYVEFSIDWDLISNLAIYKEYKDYVENKKDIPAELIGKLPIKATIMKDGASASYNGGRLLYFHLHDSDYKNWAPAIAEEAEQTIKATKQLLYQEIVQKGSRVTTSIANKSQGHLKVQFDLEGVVKNNIKDVLNMEPEDMTLVISNGYRYQDTKGDVPLLSNFDTRVPGAAYVVAYDANNKPFPMRLLTEKLSDEEADIVYTAYLQLMGNKNFKDRLDPEFVKTIKESSDSRVSRVFEVLDENEARYTDLIEFFLYQGTKTKELANPLFLEKGVLTIGGNKFTGAEFRNNKADVIKLLKERTRQINIKRVSDPKYKNYLVETNIVFTNTAIVPEGHIFIQPTVELSSAFKISKPAKIEPTDIPDNAFTFGKFPKKEGKETVKEIIKEQSIPQDNKEALDDELKKALEEAKKVNKKDKDQFDGLFRMVEAVPTPSAIYDLQSELDWYQSVLPQVPIEVIKDLIKVNEKGDTAYGRFLDGMITISEQAAKGTVYHEAFHAVFNLMLSQQERENILNEASKKYGIPRSYTNSDKPLYKLADGTNISVEYLLKAQDILQSDKAKQVFEKGKKNNWNLDKILTELAIPKEQKQLLLDLNISDREQLALELANQYSYIVEINISKGANGYYDPTDIDNFDPDTRRENINMTADYSKNSSYYSNLTVPGGTNYTENEIATPAITPSIKGHAQFSTDQGIGWFRSDEKNIEQAKFYAIANYEASLGELKSTGIEELTKDEQLERNRILNSFTKTRRILEIQSDLFQKGRNNEFLTETAKYDDSEASFEDEVGISKNQFLQLLNKDNNWVTFFVKAIIQDSAKKGYEKVLFPTGNTASKVEGHSTLEEFKKQKEDRIKELEESKTKEKYNFTDDYGQTHTVKTDLEKINNEINQLKQELERTEKEGFGALKPIYNFYENTVTNILNKTYGKENVKLITDEYGNEWYELELKQDVKDKKILLRSTSSNYYSNLDNDIQLEEKLAEEFRALKEEDKGFSKNNTGNFFRRLFNMIKSIFSKKLTTAKLFERIDRGYYKTQSPLSSDEKREPLFRRSDKFNQSEINEISDTLLYVAFRTANIEDVTKIEKLNFNSVRDYILVQIEKAVENKDLELAKRWLRIKEDFISGERVNYNSDLYKTIEEKLNSLGIINKNAKKKAEDEEGEEDEQGRRENEGLGISPSYQVSDRESATAAVKLFIALTPDISTVKEDGKYEYNLGSFLGLPKFANFNSTWNKVKELCSDIVPIVKDGKMQDAFDIMVERISEDSLYSPELSYVAEKLKTLPEEVQTQFYFTMSGTKINYTSTFMSQNNKGEWSVKIGNPDVQSADEKLRDEWSEIFKDNYVVEKQEGLYLNDTVIASLQDRKNKAYELIKHSKGELSAEAFKVTMELLNATGIAISPNGLRRAIHFAKGETQSEKLRNIFTSDEYGLAYLYDSVLPKLKGKNLMTEEGEFKSVLKDEKSVKYLALNMAHISKQLGQNTILGPEGNMYYIYSKHNLMTKTLAEWKQNPDKLKRHWKDVIYNQNSLWLEDMASDPKKLRDFTIHLFNNFKEEAEGEEGASLSDLKETDELTDRFNRILSGYAVGLAKADKSADYHISGITVRKSRVRYIDGKIGFASDTEVSDILLGYLFDELKRIEAARNEMTSLREEEKIIYYHYQSDVTKWDGNAFKVYLFPELNFDQEGLNLGLFYKDGSPIVTDVDGLRNNKALIDFIKQKFLGSVRSNAAALLDKGIIYKDSKGAIHNNSIAAHLVAKYTEKQSFEEGLYEMIGDFVLNGVISNIEHSKLFTGDPAFYKSKGTDLFADYKKRIPAIIASGSDFRIMEDMKSTYTSAVISNIDKYASPYFTDPKTIKLYAKIAEVSEEEAKAILSGYEKVNITDAQAWITLSAYRERMRGWGKWTSLKQAAYAAIRKWESQPEDDNLKARATELSIKAGLMMQPLKTVHVELEYSLGKAIMNYNKQSEAVLNPLMTYGTELNKLKEAMENQGVEHVVVLDGKKVGAKGISKIADPETGKLNEEIRFNKPTTLSYKNLLLQQDLPTKGMKDTLVGSQVKKNVINNVKLDKAYELDGKDILGADLVAEIHAVESAISNLGKAELLEELGYNDEDGTINADNLRAVLKKSLMEGATTPSLNLVEALELGIPLEAMPNYRKKMHNQLVSMITKATVKVKSYGGSFIQLADFGFADLKDSEKQGVIWLANEKKLNPPRLVQGEDGKIKMIPGQVLLPHKALRSIEGWKDMTPDQIKAAIDPDVLKGIGYRIPNQDTSSNDVIEVVGFLPPSVGDTMVAYTEITTKTGSDFDIDKQYVMLPAYEVIDNRIVKIKFDSSKTLMEQSKEALDNRRLELYTAVFGDPKTYAALVKPIDADWLKDTINTLFKEDSSVSGFDFFSPIYQMNIKRQFQGGKFGVGQTANQLVDHAISQLAGLYFSQYYIGRGRYTEANGIKETDLSQIKDEDGNIISSNLSAFLNAYVDIAKNPYIARANQNTLTANITFMLLRAGVSREWVIAFIGQPIIKKYAEATFASESNTSMEIEEEVVNPNTGKKSKRKLTALDMVIRQYPNSSFADAAELTAADISYDELVSNIVNKDKEAQGIKELEILKLFLKLQDKSKVLSRSVLASKADTNGAGTNLITAKIASNNRMLVENSGELGNFNNKFAGTMLGTYYENSVELAREITRGLFFTETNAVENTMTQILNDMGRPTLLDEELGNIITEELYAYIMSNPRAGFQLNPQELKDLFYGPNSIASQLNKLKHNPNSKHKDRTLIKYLDVKKGLGKKPDFVGVSKTKQTPVEVQDLIYQDWEAMLNSENPAEKKFGETLLKAAYYQSGFRNNLYSFFDYIPSKWIKDNGLGNFIQDELISAEEEIAMYENFTDQFFKNNWKNNKIVPNLNPMFINSLTKAIPKGVMFYLNENSPYTIGKNEDGQSEFRRFVKTKPSVSREGKPIPSKLYKLVGYQMAGGERTAIYMLTNKLGYNEKGRVIKEYYFETKKALSFIEKNNLPLSNLEAPVKDNIKTIISKLEPVRNIVDFDRGTTPPSSPADNDLEQPNEACSTD